VSKPNARPGGSFSIRQKILLAFLAMAAMNAAFGWSAVRAITQSGALVVEAYDRSLMTINHVRAAQAQFGTLRAEFGEAEGVDPAVTAAVLDAGLAVLREDFVIARGRALSPQTIAAVDRTAGMVESWAVAARREIPVEPASATMKAAAAQVAEAFDLLINFAAADGFLGRQRALAEVGRQRFLAVCAFAAALALSAAVAVLLARRILGQVAVASTVAADIAAGRLEVAIPQPGSDELGRLLRSMASMRDRIREMMDRERTQRRSAQTRLVDALEGSREGVVLVDSEGAILLANSQARAFLPRHAEAITPGQSYAALIAAACESGWLTIVGEDDDTLSNEARLADGRWIRLSRSASTEGGFVGIWSEITVLKEREAVLRDAKERAESASRAKTEFLANMSHELRTPLNAVIGFSELMTREMLGPIGQPRYKEFADDILRSGRHLLDIINDILTIAKSEAGKLTLDVDEVDIADVVEECRRTMGESAARAGLTLDCADMRGLPRLAADSVKLRQVLLNLLSNAIKFTPSGGRIALEAASAGDMLAVRIADTGIGMKPGDIPIALAPFGQVDSKLSRKYEGTGLGLPLTKAFVELHGGRLEIESAPDCGTRVTVLLPVGNAARRAA
jgi:signal transduction histidine kinase/HAMP domain-containing protein